MKRLKVKRSSVTSYKLSCELGPCKVSVIAVQLIMQLISRIKHATVSVTERECGSGSYSASN